MNNYSYIKEIKREYTSAELAMQDAYISLLEAGENISVRTVVEEAKVERSTFYAFYERTNEIRDQIENRIASDLIEDEMDLSLYLEKAFSIFAENKRDIHALLCIANSHSFYQKVIDAVKYYFSNIIREYSIDNEILLDALSSTIINPLISYVENERDANLSYIEQLIEKILFKEED